MEQSSGVTNLSFVSDEPRRKVSISLDAIHADEERKRKLSSNSDKHRQRKVSSPGSIVVPAEERYRKLSSTSGRLRRSFVGHHGNRYNVSSDTVKNEEGLQRKTSNASSKCQTENNNFQHLNNHHPCYTYDNHQHDLETPKSSWWFSLCIKCRQKEPGQGWEPSFWPHLCPYPYCPSYRYIARCLSLVLLMAMTWGVVYSIVGEDAAPGGQLFDIAVLVISANLAGYVFRMCNLPGLVGMLLIGILYQNIGLTNIHGPYMKLCSILRKIALVIILTRAGLDLDPGAMRKLFVTTLKIGLVPWVVEAAVVLVFAHFFLDMPFMWCLLLGSVVAAVSPAVIVPGLLRLRGKGYGVAKGIPTIVIAISGIDDASSVAAFGIFQSFMFSENSMIFNIASGPGSVIIGLVAGASWGFLSKCIPEKGDPFVVPMRILMLFGGGMISVFGSEAIHLDGAGPLAVVSAAFVSSWLWSTQGWDVEDNPAASAFEIFWMVFEPILFSLTGTQIRINEIDHRVFTISFIGLLVAFLLRICVTLLVSFGASLNFKEKLFISFACMSKASVQAALAPVALDTIVKLGRSDTPERGYAEITLMICVMCIIMTAPTGAMIIYFSGPRLLSKTAPGIRQNHRHGARPSLRDITVIDEGNESDDIERRMSRSNSIIGTPRPSTVIPPTITEIDHI